MGQNISIKYLENTYQLKMPDEWRILITKLFNTIFQSNKISDEWRRSILVPIFKNKGDIQSCINYRGIKLMSHTMNLWERVIEHRLRKLTIVFKNQFGCLGGSLWRRFS
jgi:hypothetical protein